MTLTERSAKQIRSVLCFTKVRSVMTKENLLAQRARQLQRELTGWARKISLLAPGEQLVFTLRVNRRRGKRKIVSDTLAKNDWKRILALPWEDREKMALEAASGNHGRIEPTSIQDSVNRTLMDHRLPYRMRKMQAQSSSRVAVYKMIRVEE